jgi:Recombination enhancement, RecA-dependent nuclease
MSPLQSKNAKAATVAERERWTWFQKIGCVACTQRGYFQPSIEVHHQNLDGHAGQKRLGHSYTIPLCSWHHRGQAPLGMTSLNATQMFGPSLAREPRRFRDVFGSDSKLLDTTNNLIRELKSGK